jgi:hypothetical protein
MEEHPPSKRFPARNPDYTIPSPAALQKSSPSLANPAQAPSNQAQAPFQPDIWIGQELEFEVGIPPIQPSPFGIVENQVKR